MIYLNSSIKKIVFRVSAVFLGCVALIIGLQCYLSFAINNDNLKVKIAVFFSDNMSKAVKYDSAKIWFFGGVTLKNFYLSRNDDFNDNLPLIRCENLYIGLSLSDLLRKNIVIQKISFKNAEISISKQYADTHKMFWKTLLLPVKKYDSLQGFAQDGLRLIISNSRIIYREIFESDTIQITTTGFDSEINIRKDGRIEYSATGLVEPRLDGRGSSRFNISGYYFDSPSYTCGTLDFSVKDLDLAHFNPYISSLIENKVSINGYGKIEIHSLSVNDSSSITGKISVDDCTAKINRGGPEESLVMKSSFASSFSADIIEGRKYHIRNCNIYDGNVDLTFSGIYQKSESDQTASFSYNLDSCDIDKLIDSYRFVKNMSMDGTLSSSGVVYLDNARSITDYVNASLKIKNLELKGSSDLSWVGKIKGDISTDFSTDSAKFRVNGFLSESPITVSLDSFIRNYSPVASDTLCTVISKRMKFEFFKNSVSAGLNTFLNSVYTDRKQEYEDVKFLSTPVGSFINSNDFFINISFPELYVDKAAFTNFSADVKLKKGVLQGGLDSSEGFGAKYSASIEGFLNSDYPKITVKGTVDNFDVGSFSSRTGVAGIKSGILSASLQYNMNGNRLAHFVDNGLLESSLTISNLYTEKSEYITSFENYMKARGYNCSFMPLSIQSGKIEYRQTGENGAFTTMNLVSDRFRMEGYGRYTYIDGLNISGTLSVIPKDIQTPSVPVPYKITGAFGAPVFKTDIKGKPSDGFILY